MENFSNNEIGESIYLLIKNKSEKDMVEIMEKVVFLDKKRIFGNSENLFAILKKIIHKQEGILEAYVSSAEPLDENQKKDIVKELKRRYSATEIILIEKIDISLLGGFKIEIGNEVIDLSIKSKISKLQEHLIKQI